MGPRFDIRVDAVGWTVFDRFTGWPVLVHDAPQIGLDIQDASDLAEILGLLAESGRLRQIGDQGPRRLNGLG